MSEVSTELSKFIDDFISKNGNETDKKIWEKKGKKWFLMFVDSKINKEEKKEKKGKKASTPKRAMTPYNLYVKEQFPIIQKECPSMSPQNVMKEIAKNWNQTKKSSELKSKTSEDPAEEVEDNSIAKNHTFFVFELFNSLFNVNVK
jgi:hypothetical protein